ncbi:hypothetical protein NLG97_g1744 [Lecanicillium saksenae]|uniref:Uncharacterized protein n=1 Tax=Lecanicillium saksenae TaxID=468837 RepID=A0ACC1R349_9HYPO|nr:hypothetical protein NLG97_g1744 [Lecanicillium saksenae]
MKVIVPALFLTAAVSALDISSLLQQTGPLIKKGKCALPCLYQAANKLECGEGGSVDAICDNIDQITKNSTPCVQKCGIDSQHKGVD